MGRLGRPTIGASNRFVNPEKIRTLKRFGKDHMLSDFAMFLKFHRLRTHGLGGQGEERENYLGRCFFGLFWKALMSFEGDLKADGVRERF